MGVSGVGQTFIFANVFESKRQPRVFSLDYADLSECTSTDDPQQPEMIQIDYVRTRVSIRRLSSRDGET